MNRSKRGWKRFLALFLVCSMALSVFGAANVKAAGTETETAKAAENGEDPRPGQESSDVAQQSDSGIQGQDSGAAGKQADGIAAAQEKDDAGLQADETAADPAGSGAKPQAGSLILQYVCVGQPEVPLLTSQDVVVSVGEGAAPTGGTLFCSKEDTGEALEVQAAQAEGQAVRFHMDFTEEAQTGIYRVTQVQITTAEAEETFVFSEYGMDIRFGVNQACETAADAVIEEAETGAGAGESAEPEVTFLTIDEDGGLVERESVEEILALAEGTSAEAQSAEVIQETGAARYLSGRAQESAADGDPTQYQALGPRVIVLDPGHGGSESGAVANGVMEKDLTLKIAKYCKEELEQYNSVEVYLTREGDGKFSNDVGTDLQQRVDFAKARNADIFVSIHLNSTGFGTAYGAEVYYPNGNYNAAIGNSGSLLAQKIQEELVALGLADRGIKIRTSDVDEENEYPDGSTTDYYAVIRNSKLAGFPGIIIEHAFLDNKSDYDNYLSSDAKLKELGQADARGIAEYFSLVRGGWVKDGNDWYYRDSNGTNLKDRWLYNNCNWYHFGANGKMDTGWQKIGDYTYYFAASGEMYEGRQTVDGVEYEFRDGEGGIKPGWLLKGSTWYYIDTNLKKMTGFQTIGGKKYYLEPDGAMVTGWKTIENRKYYFDGSGAMVTGWHTIDGMRYYFGENGLEEDKTEPEPQPQVSNGWSFWNGNWYYYTNGQKDQGWKLVNGVWYYLTPGDGAMKTGWLKLGETWYYLTPGEGSMKTGWLKLGETWYYLTPGEGSMKTGWLKLGETWYYLTPGDGAMKTGWLKLGNIWYYLTHGDGAMKTGWLKLGETWYYLTPGDGAMKTGWLKLEETWYYLTPGDGAMKTGWLKLGETWYYLAPEDGAMKTGWLKLGETWYYLMPGDGAMKTGWLNLGNIWYYLTPGDGAMITGWKNIGGRDYFFNGSGAMVTGWQTINGQSYYFGEYGLEQGTAPSQGSASSGASSSQGGDTKSGWWLESGSWYYYKSGNPAKGWLKDKETWYYLDSESGKMATGWITLGNDRYYLNPAQNTYGAEGAMAVGYREIDGTWYYFNKGQDPEGALTYTGVTPIMGESELGARSEAVRKMTAMYNKQGKAYPSAALSKGGAADIKTFCDILYDEAVKEGVKPEVVFGQAMNETGYLQFGGDVKIEQFNFAGLGATGNGVAGNKFSDVATGLRAQVQHLKAYASDADLNGTCVDVRFQFVVRKTAPYVEWLGIQENPEEGRGWAASRRYGFTLMDLYIRPMYGL